MKQMKNRWFLLLSVLLVVSLVVSFGAVAIFYIPPEILNNDWNNNRKDLESSGLEASAPRIFSGPSDGSVFHGERNVTPGYGQVVHEVWTPGKPWGYYNLKSGSMRRGTVKLLSPSMEIQVIMKIGKKACIVFLKFILH